MLRVKKNFNGHDLELQTVDAKTTYTILDPSLSALVRETLEDHDKRAGMLVGSPERRKPQRVCASPLKKRRAIEETRTSTDSDTVVSAHDVTAGTVPSKHHCKLRAMSYWPKNSFFRSVCRKCLCECAEGACCKSCGGPTQRVLLLQLRLSDDTGTFDAILADREAEYFFTGKRDGADELSEGSVIRVLNSVLAESSDSIPNVDCQVVSYFNEDKTKVLYAIHETTVTKLK